MIVLTVFLWLLAPVGFAAAGGTSGDEPASAFGTGGKSEGWFRIERAGNLAAVAFFATLFFILMRRGRQGKSQYIRPIAGLEAIEEAVGRATEMGRPVIYVPGLTDVSDPATAASLSILSKVAFKTAKLRCRLKVPNYSPLTWPVATSVVEDAYARAGRAEAFDPDDVPYLTSRHMTYTMAVVGMMTRERVAANLLIGHFFSESLILAETGAAAGAKQIGGCDTSSQLPFFVTTCDYTLIGEELFAAGALIGDDPVSRSTIAAHDWFKAAVILLVIASLLLMILDGAGVTGSREIVTAVKGALTEGGN